ncbi:hypothetical protein F5884DRAFT_858728 [Xylogone sp. PMI_703]|nr:hypothetical protein F5884DRAFT_858728 [Xylogone sp. PMI_703]
MAPPPQLDYHHQPQPMEINLSSSRFLPPPSAASSSWEYSSPLPGDMSTPFGAPGMTRVAHTSQISIDSQTRALEQSSIQQWYAANDGPWLPKTLIDPALRALSQDRAQTSNPQPSFDTRCRPHNASDSDGLLFQPTPSDSGYGTATRRSVGNASVYSADMNEREVDCQSFNEPVPVDQQLYNGLGGISSTRDIGTDGAWDPLPTIIFTPASTLVCPFCEKPVRTKSELKKHELRHNKPFKCQHPSCTWSQGFSTPNDLERHTNSKHPARGTKRFRCPIPGCKSKNKSWPRSDNFKNHLKRLHASSYSSDREQDELIQQAAFIYDGESPVKEDNASSGPDLKDTISQPVLDYEDNVSSKGEPLWENTSYPVVLEDPEGYFAPHGHQLRHYNSAEPSELQQNDSSLGAQLPTTFQPLEIFPSRATEDSERKLPSEDTISSSMDPKGKDISSADSGRSDAVVSRPDAKAARQNIDSASDATSTEEVKPTAACSQAADGDAQHDGLLQGSESKYISSLEDSIKPLESLSTSGTVVDQSQEVGTKEERSPREEVDAGQLIKQLEKLGYKIQSPKNSSSNIKKPRSLGSPKPSLISTKKSWCRICGKYQGRPSELRKHMQRHERPWGCTFRDCSREFGSKNDWKRHETSQHFQHETWRCDEQRPEGGDCAKLSHKRKTFAEHLKTAHDISNEDVVNAKAEKCRIGRNGQTRFWCGFCRKLIDLKKRGHHAWTERFDHIDDHFIGRKEGKQRNIQEWVDINMLKPRGESLYDHHDSESSESNDDGRSSKPSGPGEASGTYSLPNGDVTTERSAVLKRARTEAEDSRPSKKRKSPTSTDVKAYCCQCGEGPVNLLINNACPGCNIRFCPDCEIENGSIVND